jgi:hypothetical protein
MELLVNRSLRLNGSFIKLNSNNLLTIFWKKFVVASLNGNSFLIGWNFWLLRSPRLKGPFIKLNSNNLLKFF